MTLVVEDKRSDAPSPDGLRSRSGKIYDKNIAKNGFGETDGYYRRERECYWRSLSFLRGVLPPPPVKLLETGNRQVAILCKKLFGYGCASADISNAYSPPVKPDGLSFFKSNLVTNDGRMIDEEYGAVLGLHEVIEHIPLPFWSFPERLISLCIQQLEPLSLPLSVHHA